MWYGHGGWMVLGWVLPIAVIALVIWYASRTARQSDRSASAEELLRQRYANGEIDEEEYRQRLSVLREQRR